MIIACHLLISVYQSPGHSGGWSSSRSSGDCDCTLAGFLQTLLALAVVIVIMVPIAAIPIGLGVWSSQRPKSDIATNFYSPGDSRLISFSSFFCESISFSVESKGTGASFFLVDSAPPLTNRNNFTISSIDILQKNNYHFWQYHLYPNSKVSMNLCTDCSRVFLDAYVVKGNTNVNRWGDNPDVNVAEMFQSVSTVCPNEQQLEYIASEEDEYYFIVHNSFDEIELYYNLTLTVERFEYESPTTDVDRDRCAVSSGGNCAVDIPYGTGTQQVVVVTTIPENVEWGENVDIKTSCSRRHWAYAVVVLVPLFVIAVGITVIVLLICCYCCLDFEEVKIDENTRVERVDGADNIDSITVHSTNCDFDNIDKIDT